MALRHPFLADFKVRELDTTRLLDDMIIKPVTGRNKNLEVEKDRTGFLITSRGEEGTDVEGQTKLIKIVTNAIKDINENGSRPSQFKEIFRSFREMNKPMQNTGFKMRLPDFDLQKGEALGIQILNTNLLNEEIKGGITLIVTG
jgi:hypothetical protein